MNTAEQNLKIWNKANGQSMPNKLEMQIARSMECKPEFLGSHLWQTPSTTKPNVVHKQTVYFDGFDDAYTHGLKLNIECTCPARVECIHALKIQRVYCANWSYLFILFGLEESTRMGELWARANAVWQMVMRDRELRQVPVRLAA